MILLLILLLFVCSQQEKPDLYSILKQADSYGPIYDYDRNVFHYRKHCIGGPEIAREIATVLQDFEFEYNPQCDTIVIFCCTPSESLYGPAVIEAYSSKSVKHLSLTYNESGPPWEEFKDYYIWSGITYFDFMDYISDIIRNNDHYEFMKCCEFRAGSFEVLNMGIRIVVQQGICVDSSVWIYDLSDRRVMLRKHDTAAFSQRLRKGRPAVLPRERYT